jgi:predicted XRE-type DNA-binding protein
LGLDPVESIEWSVRATLNDKIISVVKARRITHFELSAAVGTSRPRITALLNRRRSDISTDLMLRVLAHLGVVPKLTFRKARAG